MPYIYFTSLISLDVINKSLKLFPRECGDVSVDKDDNGCPLEHAVLTVNFLMKIKKTKFDLLKQGR